MILDSELEQKKKADITPANFHLINLKNRKHYLFKLLHRIA